MTQPRIEIFTTRTCPFCIRAKQLLNQKGLSYEETDVGADPSLRDAMTRRAGKRSVPQIFVGDFHVGGCDELYAMERAGKLDPLVKGAA
ncbi:glutaredoxin 3 [Paracoccus sp. 1_MG-2023]|uniref:glutaredoxin 3 n=1 Tax=unclassified Paracoccus (in: a-proteobacteria) TaxID=2688777 RepID=UPI001C0A3812|nr:MULTISPECIES: glutaredoxin 3 [unclassified Paracoccus (in: a-proteobacteria)]MBU2957034.1 glutaredoxin 3 [Paracoccus sp. C2R09]MDO6668232.1 glutaredoxin 3 [Paracoccus sp. 1_MG-2023]